MNNRGTLADLMDWAKNCLPTEETRAQSAITTCRKANLFTKGGRGRHAPFTNLTDFPTAILAILHNGAATKSDDIVLELWDLSLKMLAIDDPATVGPVEQEPEFWNDQNAGPYLQKFNLKLGLGSESYKQTLLMVLTQLFDTFAPHRDFHCSDRIVMETCGDKKAVKIVLHGGYRVTNEGWTGEGPDHSQVTLTFGDLAVYQSGAIRTTRIMDAVALNELSLMAPNVTKDTTA